MWLERNMWLDVFIYFFVCLFGYFFLLPFVYFLGFDLTVLIYFQFSSYHISLDVSPTVFPLRICQLFKPIMKIHKASPLNNNQCVFSTFSLDPGTLHILLTYPSPTFFFLQQMVSSHHEQFLGRELVCAMGGSDDPILIDNRSAADVIRVPVVAPLQRNLPRELVCKGEKVSVDSYLLLIYYLLISLFLYSHSLCTAADMHFLFVYSVYLHLEITHLQLETT